MDVYRQLITHVVCGEAFKTVVNAGIRREWIADPEALAVWDFILEYFQRYGTVPSDRVVRNEWPTYDFDLELEPLEYVLDQVRERRRTFILDAAVYKAAHSLQDGDSARAVRELSVALADVQAEVPTLTSVDLTATGAQRLERYRELRNNDGALRGITTGFTALDAVTGGWKGGNFAVFGGRPKSGKSSMLAVSAIGAWMAGKKVAFVSFEMTEEEQSERVDSIGSMVSHTDLRAGSLVKAEFKKVEKFIKRMELFPNFWLLNDPDSATSPSGVLANVDLLRPDVLIIDGLYMMQDDITHEVGTDKALRNICAALKFGAMRRDIPILGSTQMLQSKMHGEEVTLASFGYSSGFAQWADALIGVQVTEDPYIAMIRLLACRTAVPMDFWYYRNWSTGRFYEMKHNPFGDDDGDHDDKVF